MVYFGQKKVKNIIIKNKIYFNGYQNKNILFFFYNSNHENFELLNKLPEEELFGGKVGVWKNPKTNNKIYHLKRGEVYLINGKKFLVVGGAESQDKNEFKTKYTSFGVKTTKELYRQEGVNWWREEELSEIEKQNVLNNLDKHNWEVDYVLSHTCPTKVGIDLSIQEAGGAYNYSSTKFDKFFKRANCSVGVFLQYLLDKGLKAKEWHFGHWHLNDSRSIQNDIKFRSHYNLYPLEILFQ